MVKTSSAIVNLHFIEKFLSRLERIFVYRRISFHALLKIGNHILSSDNLY